MYKIIILFITLTSCNHLFENETRVVDEKVRLKLIHSFNFEEGKIGEVWTYDSLLYVTTESVCYTYVYNLKGKLVKRMGTPGEAPWQNGYIGAFTYEEDKLHYWVQDMKQSLLKRYTTINDSMVFYTKLQTRSRVQYIGAQKFLIFRQDNNKILFSIFDPFSNIYIKDFDILKISNGYFSKTIPNFSDYIFTYGMSTSQDNNLVLAHFLYISGFVIYDKNTEQMSYYNDIRNLEYPKIGIENGLIKLKPFHILYGLSSIDTDFTYLLSTKFVVKHKWSEGKEYFIDIYANKNGQYIKSINLPVIDDEPPFGIRKIKNKVISFTKNGTISIFEAIL